MDNEFYQIAKKKVKEKKRFYTHFTSWAVMSVFFILLNLFTSDVFWAVFPILGWGVGLAFHAIRVYSVTYGEDWEDREIKKEISKMKLKERSYSESFSDSDYV